MSAPAKPIRIVVADDQALVRAGFRMILETQPDLAVVAEASNGEEAVAASAGANPDIVLMDIRMPVMDGLEATRRILVVVPTPPVRVVMLTTFDLDDYVYSALRSGASGFLLKDVSPEQLIAGVRSVAAGDALLSPAITRRLIERWARPASSLPGGADKLGALTQRELEILQLLAKAMSNSEIAASLVLSEATVKTHVARVLSKLELRDRVQAVVFAYEAGLIEQGGRSSAQAADARGR
jgi:DNA-binding NarL/FixJ family response regulator